MEATEMTKPESSQTTTPNDTHGGGLKYEEVARFWQQQNTNTGEKDLGLNRMSMKFIIVNGSCDDSIH